MIALSAEVRIHLALGRPTCARASTALPPWCSRFCTTIRSADTCSCSGASANTAHHSTYRLGFARVAYPWHPLHGRRLRIGQRTTRDGADLLLVAERDGTLRELPAWMCDEAACAEMTPGPPMVAVTALSELALVLGGLAAMEDSPASSGVPAEPEASTRRQTRRCSSCTGRAGATPSCGSRASARAATRPTASRTPWR